MESAGVAKELERRGFVQQITNQASLTDLLNEESVYFYIGFDPTADSLHVGHLMGIMAMLHMQRYGHRPIAIVGGGTAMIGDPSGKTEMRKMMTREKIEANTQKIKQQLSRYIDFGPDKAILVDNWEWLGSLNYIQFLRDIGRHFSVNRMLSFETYKRRLDSGLSFLEFNYQLLQAYDFYMLFKRYGCRLQMGGDDQWANILAGTDLIRRLASVEAYGYTFPLLATASGAKMGKTESGALWLDENKTSPYDYYQYWVNLDDRDVLKCLKYFTVLPVDEIDAVSDLKGEEYNKAKTVLAFEATALTHGEKAAKSAMQSAAAAFGAKEIPTDFLPSSRIPRGVQDFSETDIPSISVDKKTIATKPKVVELLGDHKLVKSRSEARRLVKQGGVYINGERITDTEATVSENAITDGKISVRVGKKKHYHILVNL